jgi:hypothetical protein
VLGSYISPCPNNRLLGKGKGREMIRSGNELGLGRRMIRFGRLKIDLGGI